MNLETRAKTQRRKVFLCNFFVGILRLGGGVLGRLLGYLLPLIQEISKRIEKYFQPSEEELKDERKLHAHAEFLLDSMMCGAVLIRELDEKAKNIFLPNGVAVFEIEATKTTRCLKISEGKITLSPLHCHCEQGRDGRSNLPEGKGKAFQEFDVKITFCDPRVLVEASQQKLDSMAAMGLGRIKVTGFIPLAEGLDLVMNRIKI